MEIKQPLKYNDKLDDVYASIELAASLPKTKFRAEERDPRNICNSVRDELIIDGIALAYKSGCHPDPAEKLPDNR